jgi:hypothetical protein
MKETLKPTLTNVVTLAAGLLASSGRYRGAKNRGALLTEAFLLADMIEAENARRIAAAEQQAPAAKADDPWTTGIEAHQKFLRDLRKSKTESYAAPY